jgi:hypothetical protein
MITEEDILQLTNNINEGIDTATTKADLRKAITYWARACADEATKRAAAESRLTMIKSQVEILNVILK